MITLDRDKLKMYAFNIIDKKVFYFDQDGIVRIIPYEKREEYPEIKGLIGGFDGHTYIDFWQVHFILFERVNFRVLQMALSRIKEGDSIDDMERYINTLYPKSSEEKQKDELERFICRVYRPEFLRVPENTNKKTFDFITIEASVLSAEAMQNRDEYLRQNISEICGRLIKKIEKSCSFQKYGIPISCLRASEITFHKKISLLKVVFELKQLD